MWGREILERKFPPHEIDMDNDGRVDYIKPRRAAVFYCKNLLPDVALCVVLQLVSAAIFISLEEWDYGDALYHCIVTATTVCPHEPPRDPPADRAADMCSCGRAGGVRRLEY